MLNRTELMALEWLKGQGYKDNEIIKQNNKTPDFVCQDGKRYEVKFLYGNRIIFYNTQIEELQNDDVILVFDRTQFVRKFLWSNRKNISINIYVVNRDNNKINIQLEKETVKDLKKLKITKLETYDEIIKRLLQDREK